MKIRRGMSPIDRVLDRTEMRGPGGCWIFTGPLNANGYGRVSLLREGRSVSASTHRIVYEGIRGPIPAGMELDHLCRIRCCVNPDHLEPVTHKENTLRGTSPAAQQARQSHCKRGHELVGDNIYEARKGARRSCRLCARQRARERKERLRALRLYGTDYTAPPEVQDWREENWR